tara:strand:+ start:1023 stop:1277 length:255 start_codon:yes stop_codon:yes gene_type:complete
MGNYYQNRNGTYLDPERDARVHLQKAQKKCRTEAAALRKLVREYLDCVADVPMRAIGGLGYCDHDLEESLRANLAKAANYKGGA